jgi:cytochrome c551/c552
VRPRRLGAACALALLLAGLLAPGGTWGADAAPSRQAGERVALAKGCGACHALPGEARGQKPGPSFLAAASPQPASEVLRRLWNHIPGMRQDFLARGLAWPAIQAQEMADLLAFLGMQPGLERSPNLDRGRVLLLQKGCLKCHALAGEGARVAPDLARFRQFGSPVPLAAALWNHAPAMLDRIDKSGIPYPVFQEGEMADLLGFLGAFADVSR